MPAFNPSVVTSATKAVYTPPHKADVITKAPWGIGGDINCVTTAVYDNFIKLNTDMSLVYGILDTIDSDTKLPMGSFDLADTVYLAKHREFLSYPQTVTNVYSRKNFTQADTDVKDLWAANIPVIDMGTLLPFAEILTTAESLYSFHFDESFKPLDFGYGVYWGYGLNNFIVGGSTSVPSTATDDAVTPPDGEVIEHINYEVYNVVNTVNMTVQPSGTGIQFSNFNIQRDIESFAWTVTFDVLDKASFDLIRPQGRTLKTIDITINTETFTMVVAKGSIQRTQGSVSYRCSGWSQTKLLAYPYATKRSFTDTQARTAAQIVNEELIGTGFTYTWNTVDWLVPLGVHSYQDKTPMGAILEVCNAVGGVVIPHPTATSFDVQPYYPISPWSWGIAVVDRTMFEAQFFETSSETIPKQNPDGVFVYGEESGGVGVKAVRAGFPGTALLPDVVDKYITVNTAGQERGRVEVAKNSFIERIPMTTYVDEFGIIMPQELIEFTDVDAGTWRGMVLSTSVSCERVGTALSQTIVVARFYE